VFDPNQDRRRKFILRQTKEELDSSEILLDNVAQAFSKGDNAQLQLLLSSRLAAYLDENLTESGIGSIQVLSSHPHSFCAYQNVNLSPEGVRR
jgi:predicted lipid-binding transport protein (Tim44 family)